jgi:hypothetical protein
MLFMIMGNFKQGVQFKDVAPVALKLEDEGIPDPSKVKVIGRYACYGGRQMYGPQMFMIAETDTLSYMAPYFDALEPFVDVDIRPVIDIGRLYEALRKR